MSGSEGGHRSILQYVENKAKVGAVQITKTEFGIMIASENLFLNK
jgi:hypothetical protein